VRISIEGTRSTNDRVRGLRDGFDRAVASYRALRDLGMKDIGFAVTVQDENAADLLDLYEFVRGEGAEFAQAVPHNGYYFHKEDNAIRDVEAVQAALREG
jgi:MoaA/NifB/PqqE/SkfB family radical SAM enzyme